MRGEIAKARCRQIYDYIDEYHTLHKYAPCYREICKAVGINRTTVHYYIQMMLERGQLETDVERSSPRAIRVGTRP